MNMVAPPSEVMLLGSYPRFYGSGLNQHFYLEYGFIKGSETFVGFACVYGSIAKLRIQKASPFKMLTEGPQSQRLIQVNLTEYGNPTTAAPVISYQFLA
jgi:hypothetical protein